MIKKMILLLLFFSCIYAQTAVAPTSGDGSESNPYQIASLSNLYWIATDSLNWDKHYIQTADIDMSACQNWKDSVWTGYEDYYDYVFGWTPIGNVNCEFSGEYNGQYNTISNLYFHSGEPTMGWEYAGLFGCVDEATISNIIITNANIELCGYSGILAGACDSSLITNCACTGSVNGMHNLGGIVGYVANSTIQYCYTDVDVNAGDDIVGGIAGYLLNSMVNDCYSKSNVVGFNVNTGPIAGVKVNSTLHRFYCTSPAVHLDRAFNGVTDADCFWQEPGVWYELFDHNRNSQLKTSREMKDPNLYLNAGWDFVIETENGTDNIWDIDTSGVINDGYPFLHWEHPETIYFTSINDIQIPDNYCLYQNYPNPFNPSTTISYQLLAVSDIHMIIFDLSGRKIQQWSCQNQIAGTYEITWNGKDQNGNPVPSGVYIYRMVADGFVQSKKMVLLK